MLILIVLSIMVIIYLMLICPKLSKKSPLDSLDRVYAHRGLFDNTSQCPENSMAAFRKATEAGYGIELDVHVTKDDYAVVFHDYSLLRMCGAEITIEESTYEELSKYHLLGTEERIPLLADVLKLVDHKVPLIIEIKAEEKIKHKCNIISSVIDKFNCKYCIESFHPLVGMWYKRNKPNVIRGQLSTNFYKDKLEGNIFVNFAMSKLLFNFLSKPDFIAYNHHFRKSLSFILTTKFMRALPVAWTIRSQEELDAAKENFKVFIFEGFIPKEK